MASRLQALVRGHMAKRGKYVRVRGNTLFIRRDAINDSAVTLIGGKIRGAKALPVKWGLMPVLSGTSLWLGLKGVNPELLAGSALFGMTSLASAKPLAADALHDIKRFKPMLMRVIKSSGSLDRILKPEAARELDAFGLREKFSPDRLRDVTFTLVRGRMKLKAKKGKPREEERRRLPPPKR
jgi:hypothetical protein